MDKSSPTQIKKSLKIIVILDYCHWISWREFDQFESWVSCHSFMEHTNNFLSTFFCFPFWKLVMNSNSSKQKEKRWWGSWFGKMQSQSQQSSELLPSECWGRKEGDAGGGQWLLTSIEINCDNKISVEQGSGEGQL